MNIISRKEAISLGLRKYYTGIPCKRGHLSERFIGNGGCCKCKHESEKSNPEKKKAQDKKYRETHKEKIRATQKEWVKKNPEANSATKRRYKEKHPERVKASCKKSYQKNKDKVLKYSKEWAARNPDKKKAYADKYKENNRERYLELKRNYARRWREQNPDECRMRSARHYQKNKDEIKARVGKYYRENKEAVLAYSSIYREKNKDKTNKRHRDRYARDPGYKASHIIRRMLRKQFERIGKEKYGKSHNLLGYGNDNLKQRLEFQFKDGMSWDNYGEWHVDHKKPVSRFIRQGITDPAIINALSNLQPLWAKDNLKKSDKWIY